VSDPKNHDEMGDFKVGDGADASYAPGDPASRVTPGATPEANPTANPIADPDLIELEPESEPAPQRTTTPVGAASDSSASTSVAGSAKPMPAGASVLSKRPFVRSTRVEWPLAVAGSCAALFVAACLAGQQGIFPQAATVEISVVERFTVLLRGILMMLLSGGCLVAGAAIVQLVERGPLGDLQALASRMLMISSAAILARAVPIPIAFLKQSYDILAPLAVAWLLVLIIFRIPPRDAGMVIGAAILSLLVLAFGSTIVSFAIWAGSTAASVPTP
jgi:hypothetical protein